MFDQVTDIINQERTLLEVRLTPERLDVSRIENGQDGLSSAVQPSRSLGQKLFLDLSASFNTVMAFVLGFIPGVVLIVVYDIRVIGSIVATLAPPVYHLFGQYEAILLSPLLPWANGDLVITAVGSGVIVSGLYAYCRRRLWTPAHGPPVSVLIGTAGDGITRTGYLAPSVQSTLETTIEEIAPGAETSTNVVRIGDLIGIDDGIATQLTTEATTDPTDQATAGVPITELNPYICELTYRETRPHAAFAEGVSTPALLARETNDSGLVANYAQAILSEVEVPALVEITARARPREPDRHKRFAKQFGGLVRDPADSVPWHKTDETVSRSTAPRKMTDARSERKAKPLSNLYDVSIRVLVFDTTDGKITERICDRLSHRVQELMPPDIEGVTASIDPIPSESSGVKVRPRTRRASATLDRLSEHAVAVPRLFSIQGTPTRLALRARRSIPVTSFEIWSYVGLSGKSHTSADRSGGTKSRDESAMNRPNETRMQSLRWSHSWPEFVDGVETRGVPAANGSLELREHRFVRRDSEPSPTARIRATGQSYVARLWIRLHSLGAWLPSWLSITDRDATARQDHRPTTTTSRFPDMGGSDGAQ